MVEGASACPLTRDHVQDRNLNAKLALVEPFLATFAVKLVLFFHLILVYLVIYDSG